MQHEVGRAGARAAVVSCRLSSRTALLPLLQPPGPWRRMVVPCEQDAPGQARSWRPGAWRAGVCSRPCNRPLCRINVERALREQKKITPSFRQSPPRPPTITPCLPLAGGSRPAWEPASSASMRPSGTRCVPSLCVLPAVARVAAEEKKSTRACRDVHCAIHHGSDSACACALSGDCVHGDGNDAGVW